MSLSHFVQWRRLHDDGGGFRRGKSMGCSSNTSLTPRYMADCPSRQTHPSNCNIIQTGRFFFGPPRPHCVGSTARGFTPCRATSIISKPPPWNKVEKTHVDAVERAYALSTVTLRGFRTLFDGEGCMMTEVSLWQVKPRPAGQSKWHEAW